MLMDLMEFSKKERDKQCQGTPKAGMAQLNKLLLEKWLKDLYANYRLARRITLF